MSNKSTTVRVAETAARVLSIVAPSLVPSRRRDATASPGRLDVETPEGSEAAGSGVEGRLDRPDGDGQLRFGSSYEETLDVADGRRVSLRLLQPTDGEKLREGLARMSPESRYFRFMGVRNSLDDRALRYLCDVDGWSHFALGAVAVSPDDGWDGVGVARFVRLEDRENVAEAAITVIDGYQGQGLGGLLLERLAEAARERGVDTFHCELLASNRKARRLLSSFDPKAVARQAGEVVVMELDLRRAADESHPPDPPRPTTTPSPLDEVA